MYRSWIRCRMYSGEACTQEKRYFVPDIGFCALHSCSISPPSLPAAALCPSCPPFTAQLHFFHFTSANPSWHAKKSKHTQMCLPALFLQLHLSTSRKMSGRGSRSLHLSPHTHRGDPRAPRHGGSAAWGARLASVGSEQLVRQAALYHV